MSLGTYGSAFGVSFQTGRGHFSVGMDCPNALAGGKSSIEVRNREHAHDACKMALGSDCMHGWSDKPYVDVKIADHWGTINWGRAIVIRDDQKGMVGTSHLHTILAIAFPVGKLLSLPRM